MPEYVEVSPVVKEFLKALRENPNPYRIWLADSAQRIAKAALAGDISRDFPEEEKMDDRWAIPGMAIYVAGAVIEFFVRAKGCEDASTPAPGTEVFLRRLRDEFTENDRMAADRAIELVASMASSVSRIETVSSIMEFLNIAIAFWALSLEPEEINY